MNYNTDKPINTDEQDLLGRAFFSNHLGRAIYEYNGEDGLVIGVFGKWGMGKTSIINMALNEVNKLSENDKNKPIIMKFSPWNYSDKDNLISLFFQSLKNKIDIQGNERIKQVVGQALVEYSVIFDVLRLVPGVGSTVSSTLRNLTETVGKHSTNLPDLDETREKIEEGLSEINEKIIIVIDDIDRLINSQIRDIFQLVKQLADFPNVIYILVMDREVVCRALNEVQKIDGEEYLEKIIQVPFEIPELRKARLNTIFFNKIEQIISDLPEEVTWDESDWNIVFRNCIEPYLNNLRDVNRVTNVFRFKYEMLYSETYFVDMLAITTIEVLEPKLYKWICDNKKLLCGEFMDKILSDTSDDDYRKLYCNQFENLGIDSDLAMDYVATLFPEFSIKVNKYRYDFQSMSDIRSKMRVAYSERFDLYFMVDLDDAKVPRNTINNWIYELNEDGLNEALRIINAEGNIKYFLDELVSLKDNIPYERLKLVATAIFESLWEFKDGEKFISISYLAENFVIDIIRKLKTENEKYDIIRSLLENVDKNRLGTISRIIFKLEVSYGRLEETKEFSADQLISLDHLKKIEKTYLTKIRDIITDNNPIFGISNFNCFLYLWEHLDANEVANYFKEIDDTNKLKFICALASKWNGNRGNGWCFQAEVYSKYISKDEIYKLIQSLENSKFNEFTEIELIKLASFILNYNKNATARVSEQEAREYVEKEWS